MGKVLILLIIQGGLLFSQIIPSANSAGLANSGMLTRGDLSNFINNPAQLVYSNNKLSVSFVPHQFGVKELQLQSYSVSAKFYAVNFGVAFSSYGYELYNSKKAFFAIAYPVTKQLSVGLCNEFSHLNIKNYGYKNNVKINAGFTLTFEKLIFGLALKNILQTKITKTESYSDFTFSGGVTYLEKQSFNLNLKFSNQINYTPNIAVGCEYYLADQFSTMIGYSLNPDFFSYGFRIYLKPVELSFANKIHQTLGETLFFELNINY